MAETGSAHGGIGTATPRARMARHIRKQGEGCANLGSPLYAELLRRLADDVESGGPGAEVLDGHEEDPGPSALALRLMGAVHRLVLEGSAPGLAVHYPSVGGDGDPAGAWTALRAVLGRHKDELRGLLDQPPQTNEVGRAAALIGGLAHVVDRWPHPVRLFEIGASAGLNLRADHFRVELTDGRGFGPPDSPVVLRDAWRGRIPPLGGRVDVVERAGCDTAPLDPTTADGRLRLTSYVWPDQIARLERLRGALDVAARVPATVDQRPAAEFVDRIELVPGATTVLWHSVMWQYLDRAEQAAVAARLDALGATATDESPLAHLALEPRRRTPDSDHEFLLVMRTWPAGEERILCTAAGHGPPIVWE